MNLIMRRPDAMWRRTSLGVVVLGRLADRPVAVSGTAAELWDLLRAPITLDGAADQLAIRYRADPESVRADLVAVLEVWMRDGAVERV